MLRFLRGSAVKPPARPLFLPGLLIESDWPGAMHHFLDWRQAWQAGPAVCGGKGYNLARLARYGFRVPGGGVLPMDAPLSAIHAGIARLGLAEARVAVRSSATAEDSARASFAGIHRSFLNVSGAAAIEQAAQGCIDSLQTPEAIAYRRRMGFRDDEVRCAVVVCEMVQARAAGVAFSCDPATGRRDLIAIDAAEGLGEAVVSGRVNPRRSTWINRFGWLRRLDGPAASAWLPAPIEEELAHQVQRVQWALGEGQDPQDVEWAYDGERLWLLQARPVTSLPRTGWPETAAMPRFWSTANLKDNQPNGWCELSWSMLDDAVADALHACMKAVGYPVPPGTQVIRRFHGRGFFDLTAMQYAFYDAFGVLPAEVMKTVGGHQPKIAVPPHPLKGPQGRRRRMASLRLGRLLWNHTAKSQAAVREHLEYRRSLDRVDWAGCSWAALADALEQSAGKSEAFIPVAGLANASSGPWQLGLEAIVKDSALINRLQAGGGTVASAEHGYRLYEIARGNSTVEDFLRDFGHRAVYETDIANPRWVEDPSWIVEQVEAIRANPPPRDPRESALDVRRQAERELRRRFPLRAPVLLWMARKLRESMASREAAKSAMVSTLLPVRRIALEAARRLVEAGQLDAPAQIFQMSSADLKCLLRGYWAGAGARELARDRELRREAWLAEECPDVIVEAPDGRMAARAPAPPPGADGWSGIAVSPGSASGPARVVRHPQDAAHLQQGDILIAPSTDPGWSPLFLRAAALVMETGGYLSHGAIVAREFGIPAVANVPGILDLVADGERLTVDGSAGRVFREVPSPIHR